MMTEVTIQTERVDDIPLLVNQLHVMGIPQIVDEIIVPHGNRQGLSLGWSVVGWLSYIVSQADHRMSYVESWAKTHEQTLQSLFPMPVSAQDFTDDRLGSLLTYLSQDTEWQAIEQELGQHIVQVYELPQERVRVDSTSAAVYHDPEGQPLLAFGMSKDHRPDLAQFKIMLSGLDPLGMPLATLVVPGNQADDGLYVPAIAQSREVLGRRGVLYIGDSKMEALATRANLAQAGDYYLTPLSQKGSQTELLQALLQPVWDKTQVLQDIYAPELDTDQERLVAQGYESQRTLTADQNGTPVSWTERLLVVYSPSLAKQASRGLQERLERAQEKLSALTPPPARGRRQYRELAPLQAEADKILKHYRVEGLLRLTYERQERRQQVRRYKDQPERSKVQVRYQLHIQPDSDAIAALERSHGWRLYVTNCSADQLSLADAVLTYRQSPTFERGFSRLKNRPLGLRPLYLHREDHIIGLVRLLSLALRLLTLVEFVVRRELQTHDEKLAGLYEGNPHRQTNRPTTERLLRAFDNISLTFVTLPSQKIVYVTPLTPLQSRILSLLGLPSSIYTELAALPYPISP
jgi:transposase